MGLDDHLCARKDDDHSIYIIDVASEEWFHNILIESLSMLFEQEHK